MGHTITIQMPEELYESLATRAKQIGQTPEELAARWLTIFIRDQSKQASSQDANDLLEKFIGAFHSEIPDWAEQHDKYLGCALRDG